MNGSSGLFRSQSEALDLANVDKHQRKRAQQAKFKKERKQRLMSDNNELMMRSLDSDIYKRD